MYSFGTRSKSRKTEKLFLYTNRLECNFILFFLFNICCSNLVAKHSLRKDIGTGRNWRRIYFFLQTTNMDESWIYITRNKIEFSMKNSKLSYNWKYEIEILEKRKCDNIILKSLDFCLLFFWEKLTLDRKNFRFELTAERKTKLFAKKVVFTKKYAKKR